MPDNASFIPAYLESIIVNYNYVSAIFSTIVNVLVLFLVVTDGEKRNAQYRNYVAILQILTTLTDLYLSLGAYLMDASEWTIYSDGFVPFSDITIALTGFSVLMSQTMTALFACLLFRHQSVVHSLSRWHLSPGLYLAAIGAFDLWMFAAVPTAYLVMRNSEVHRSGASNLTKPLKASMEWLKGHHAFVVYEWDPVVKAVVLGVAVFILLPLFSIILAVDAHMLKTLRAKRVFASPATKRHLRQTSLSVSLQLMIPGVFIVVPVTMTGVGAVTEALPPALTSVFFALLNAHSVINSLTILATTPSFQQALFRCSFSCLPHSPHDSNSRRQTMFRMANTISTLNSSLYRMDPKRGSEPTSSGNSGMGFSITEND